MSHIFSSARRFRSHSVLLGARSRRTFGTIATVSVTSAALFAFACSSESTHVNEDTSVDQGTQTTSTTGALPTTTSAGAAQTTGSAGATVTTGAASGTVAGPVTSTNGNGTTGNPVTGTQGVTSAGPVTTATSSGPVTTVGVTGAGGMTASVETTGSGTTGSDLPPNPSGLPEPGDGGVAQPSGAAGGLVVLPWAGYKGAISYSFDDANSTQINNEEQLLGLGVRFTWYLQTGKQEAGNAFYQRALDAGHELANHTQNHGSGAADADVNAAQSFLLSKYNVVGYTMAAPNGSTSNYNGISPQLFILDRGVSDSLIGPDDNTNMQNLPSWIPRGGANAGDFDPKTNAAASQGKWQTVCIHGFTGGSDGAYQPIDLGGFVSHVASVKEKGEVWIGTMLEVGAYFLGRKAVKAAQPQAQGSDQVYSWTLPDVFPPGQYVRVTVDGGTVSQDGVPLPWNDHGFYEVALDAGSLTISP